jgi:hypothetical protein
VQCFANSVGWDRLAPVLDELLNVVRGRVEALTTDPVTAPREAALSKLKMHPNEELAPELVGAVEKATQAKVEKGQAEGRFCPLPSALQEAELAKECEIAGLLLRVAEAVEHRTGKKFAEVKGHWGNPTVIEIMEGALEEYNRDFEIHTAGLRNELKDLDAELGRIAQTLMAGVPSVTVRGYLDARMRQLEARKSEITPQLVPLSTSAASLQEQLDAIRRAIDDADWCRVAEFLDKFVEKGGPPLQRAGGWEGEEAPHDTASG